MDIVRFREIRGQLELQLTQLLQTPTDKPVVMHANAIEINGAMQLIAQLIQEEEAVALAPKGATGPAL